MSCPLITPMLSIVWDQLLQKAFRVLQHLPSFSVAAALLMVDDVVGGQQIIVRCPKSTGNDTMMHVDS